jgi:hypothetical protein
MNSRLWIAGKAALALLLLALFFQTSCQKKAAPMAFPTKTPEQIAYEDSMKIVEIKRKAYGKPVGIVEAKDSAILKIPAEQLIPNFMREFGDGTVVDRVLIGKVQQDKKQKPRFYLVGMGLKDGGFRSMAFELFRSDESLLYLSHVSESHICASTRCKFCLFTYVGNRVNGCECSDENSDGNCTHEVRAANKFFK